MATASPEIIPALLVTGASARVREQAILQSLVPGEPAALILEGLPSGDDFFAGREELRISRIAPGCVHCTGNLTLRVTLDRQLRARPARLFIALASTEHLDAIIAFLSSPPYDAWMRLGPVLAAD